MSSILASLSCETNSDHRSAVSNGAYQRPLSPTIVSVGNSQLPISLEPRSTPSAPKSRQLPGSALDFDIMSTCDFDDLGQLSKSVVSYASPIHLPPIKVSKRSSSPSKLFCKPISISALPMKAISSVEHDFSATETTYPRAGKGRKVLDSYQDDVGSWKFEQADQSLVASMSKVSLTLNDTPLSTAAVLSGCNQYPIKPFPGKRLSKVVAVNNPSTVHTSLPKRIPSPNIALTPYLSTPITTVPSLATVPFFGSGQTEDSEQFLQIGLPDEESQGTSLALEEIITPSKSRLPSTNLVLPPSTFDDETGLHSDREPIQDESRASEAEVDQTYLPGLAQPVSLDISEIVDGKPMDMTRSKPQGFSKALLAQNPRASSPMTLTFNRKQRPLDGSFHKVAYVLAPADERSLRSDSLASFAHQGTEEHNKSLSTMSTIGQNAVAPYTVHKRVLGWKLTSIQRRKELIDMMDLMHGQVGSDLKLRLGKKKNQLSRQLQQLGSVQLAQFSNSTDALPLLSQLPLEPLNQEALNLERRSKSRQTMAWESFVTRSVKSRQGYRSVAQIKSLMEDKKKQQQIRKVVVDASVSTLNKSRDMDPHRQQRIPLGAQLIPPPPTEDELNETPQFKLLTTRPYVNAGTLSTVDKLGRNKNTASLQYLLADALFRDRQAKSPEEIAADANSSLQSSAQQLYNYPLNIHHPRDRMDILDAVKIRQELQPIMVHEASWKEDQLVDAFIAGRQNARMRRSREGGNQGGGKRGGAESTSLLQNDFFGDGWDDDSFMSMSTSAEENEAALSEALMENFGLSLHDDFDDADGDVNQSFSYIQNSAIGSEAGPNHLVTPSLHPLQPSSLAGSFRLGRTVGEEASWPDESNIPVNPW